MPDFIPYAIYCDSPKSDPLQSCSRLILLDKVSLEHDCLVHDSFPTILASFSHFSILVLILASFCHYSQPTK